MKKRRISDMSKDSEETGVKPKKKRTTDEESSESGEVSMRVTGAPGKIHFPKLRDGAELLVNEVVITRILKGVSFDIKNLYKDAYCLKWKRKTCSITVGDKTYHPRNLVYNLYVEEITPRQNIVQLCSDEYICLQPKHLMLQTKYNKSKKIIGITKEEMLVKLPVIEKESSGVIILQNSDQSSQDNCTTSLESCITDSDCTSLPSHT